MSLLSRAFGQLVQEIPLIAPSASALSSFPTKGITRELSRPSRWGSSSCSLLVPRAPPVHGMRFRRHRSLRVDPRRAELEPARKTPARRRIASGPCRSLSVWMARRSRSRLSGGRLRRLVYDKRICARCMSGSTRLHFQGAIHSSPGPRTYRQRSTPASSATPLQRALRESSSASRRTESSSGRR